MQVRIVTTENVPQLKGKVVNTTALNRGVVIVTTSFGIYSIYKNEHTTEVQLISVFEDGQE